MDEQLKKNALEYHRRGTPGKISIFPTKQLTNQRDLALAYSPGVAAACEEIGGSARPIELDLTKPASHYWPEFAAHGKGTATVGHALTHRVGVPQMLDGVTAETMCDWDAMAKAEVAE